MEPSARTLGCSWAHWSPYCHSPLNLSEPDRWVPHMTLWTPPSLPHTLYLVLHGNHLLLYFRHSSCEPRDTICHHDFGGSSPLPDLISKDSIHLTSPPPDIAGFVAPSPYQSVMPHPQPPGQNISKEKQLGGLPSHSWDPSDCPQASHRSSPHPLCPFLGFCTPSVTDSNLFV